jgi:glucose 1-dehydrogenase
VSTSSSASAGPVSTLTGPAPLTDHVAIVTGAGGGLGGAISRRLSADGATVIACYRTSAGQAQQVVADIRAVGARASAVEVDVTDTAAVAQIVDQVVAEHGRIDVLVNNAGVMRRSPFLEISEDDWDATIATNLKAYFVFSQQVARVMAVQRSGSIVHVSSTNEELASADCTAYAVSKGGVRMLTRQMALELGPFGIRTNAVGPGMVETNLNRAQLAEPVFRGNALARVPLGRFVVPADVAAAVAFLASPNAASINGATVPVDGGKIIA